MTESDWLSCSSPDPMLAFLRECGASDRKLRLFAVACSRRAWPLLDDLGRAAVEVAELFAEGQADAQQLRAVRLACKGSGGRSSWYAALTDPAIAARNAALSASEGTTNPGAERLAQAAMLRDIFGNPFRHVTFDPSWRTSTAVALAVQMYGTRGFSLMPILGDALMDAGCDDEQVLDHCRGGNEHHRGCWVVDSVLEKT